MPVGSRGDGNDAALVTATITDAALCADCIAKKTGVPLARIGPVLGRIAAVLHVMSVEARCDSCLAAKKIFRIA